MNRKQTIDAMAQAFNDADEAGLPLENCWGAALDSVADKMCEILLIAKLGTHQSCQVYNYKTVSLDAQKMSADLLRNVEVLIDKALALMDEVKS